LPPATSRFDRPVQTRRATASSDAVRFQAGRCSGRKVDPRSGSPPILGSRHAGLELNWRKRDF
jgi:hypothetical protein